MKKAKQQQSKQAQVRVDEEVKRLRAEIKKMAKTMAETAPAAVSGPNPASKSKPRVKAGKGCVVVEHREVFVWPVATSTYTCDSGTVNPGHPGVFNWLAIIARAFEQYRFRYLRFHYYPRCGTTQAGEIILALDPKSGDVHPANLQIINTYRIRAQGPMWKEHTLNVPREVLHGSGPKRFVSPGEIPDTNVRSLYDVGMFLFARDGANPAGGICGEISVEYGVELYVPSQDPGGYINSGWVNASGTMSAAAPYGTTPQFGGMLIEDVSVNTVFFKNLDHNFSGDAYYSIWIYITGTGISALSLTSQDATVSNAILIINGAATGAMYHCRYLSRGSSYIQLNVTATTVTDTLTQIMRDAFGQTF